MSAKTKKSNGIGHQFKLDMTKEGKLDVTFVRMNVLKKQLDKTHAPESLVYRYLKEKGFDNPKKVMQHLQVLITEMEMTSVVKVVYPIR